MESLKSKKVFLNKSHHNDKPFSLQWSTGKDKPTPVAGIRYPITKLRFFKAECEAIKYVKRYLTGYKIVR